MAPCGYSSSKIFPLLFVPDSVIRPNFKFLESLQIDYKVPLTSPLQHIDKLDKASCSDTGLYRMNAHLFNKIKTGTTGMCPCGTAQVTSAPSDQCSSSAYWVIHQKAISLVRRGRYMYLTRYMYCLLYTSDAADES